MTGRRPKQSDLDVLTANVYKAELHVQESRLPSFQADHFRSPGAGLMSAHDRSYGPSGRRFRPRLEGLELRDLPSSMAVQGVVSSSDRVNGPHLNLIVEHDARRTLPDREARLAERDQRASGRNQRLERVELARLELQQTRRNERIEDRHRGVDRLPMIVSM
jgi:hypothetical protein